MILTVTLNSALDHTLLLRKWEPNRTLRALQSVTAMAGKPTDASWILGKLGIESMAIGFTAGQVGMQLEHMLAERGVHTDFIHVRGQTRLNVIIVDEEGMHTTITEPTLDVLPEHIAQLRQKYEGLLYQVSCVVLGGTLPAGAPLTLYSELIASARKRNIPVIFDCSGQALVQGVQGRPSLIKPNHTELEDLLGEKVTSLEEVYHGARRVGERIGAEVVVTLGDQGMLAVLQERAYYIPPLKVKVVSPAGAGDGVLAGLTYAAARRHPLEDGLRMGTALASAILMKLATADFDVAEYERLLPQVELLPYKPGMTLSGA